MRERRRSGKGSAMATVLVVEDDESVLKVICEAVAQAGHDARCVATAAEARAQLASGGCDLVIADVRLPDGSGIDLASEAAQAGRKTLLVTGHPDVMRQLDALGLPYVAKPFQLDVLEARIRRALAP
jgi:DNA-binding response OmpR family regulator